MNGLTLGMFLVAVAFILMLIYRNFRLANALDDSRQRENVLQLQVEVLEYLLETGRLPVKLAEIESRTGSDVRMPYNPYEREYMVVREESEDHVLITAVGRIDYRCYPTYCTITAHGAHGEEVIAVRVDQEEPNVD